MLRSSAMATTFDLALSNLQHAVSLLSLRVIASLFLCNCNQLRVAAVHHENQRRLAGDISDFISIDCGSVEDSVDSISGLTYISDKDLINTGVSGQISPAIAEDYRVPYRNLRSFPEGVKNCYTLKPEAGRNNNYLIRARFIYGNYDAKNSTPAFDIYLGVNLWSTVTSNDSREEAIYVPTTDYIDVCLVNIRRGVPYISALELRRFHNSVYRIDHNLFMVKWSRYDLGIDTIVRYPYDVDDRVWEPYDDGSLKKLKTDASITRSSNDSYQLPELMLKTACGTLNSSTPFIYSWNATSSTFYFCFHFAEIEKLDSGTLREMSIVLNGVHTIAQSVKLEYLKPQTICSTSGGLPVNLNQKNYLQISAASPSNLPPIINGFEVFYFRNLSDSPTFLQDVNAIMDIKKTFKLLNSGWQGDPCLPKISLWNGLNCSRSNPPRIISLNLRSSKLIGEIPASIANLQSLTTLDLSDNELTGELPEFLVNLPNLRILNLTRNKFTGSVPKALLLRAEVGSLTLSVGENPDLCASLKCYNKWKKHLALIIISSIIAVLLPILMVTLVIYKRRKQRENLKSSIEERFRKSKNPQVRYSEILLITDNLKTTIGEGGFGKVYLGVLSDKTQVAIKLRSASSQQGPNEFRAEAQILTIVHHRNLVSLLGYCDEAENTALIFEFMANGNLRKYLSDSSTKVLSWIERLRIAVDAAQGLAYLHNGCKPPIIHRDMKSSNILLNERMQAKISDFGLSRVFANESDTHLLTRPAGTFGYMDPKVHSSGKFTKKSDVYSFGIVLFELLTAQPAVINGSEYIHVVDWAKPLIADGNIQSIVDPKLEGSIENCSAGKFAELAVSCALPTSAERPDMSDVVSQLIECLKMAQDRTPQMPTNNTDNFSYNSMGSELSFGPR